MRDLREDQRGFGGLLLRQAKDVIADIRGKLIEEGWFGRRVHEPSAASDLGWTRPPAAESAALVRHRAPSFEEQWAVRPTSASAHELQGQEIER